MKLGWVIEGKTINVDFLIKEAEHRHWSPEEASKRMMMGDKYLRNRKNEIKRGFYRTAYSGIVDRAVKAFGISREEILMDIPESMTGGQHD